MNYQYKVIVYNIQEDEALLILKCMKQMQDIFTTRESNMKCPLLECRHRRQGLLKGNLLTLKGDIVALYCLA